jgi:hypothetical protein
LEGEDPLADHALIARRVIVEELGAFRRCLEGASDAELSCDLEQLRLRPRPALANELPAGRELAAARPAFRTPNARIRRIAAVVIVVPVVIVRMCAAKNLQRGGDKAIPTPGTEKVIARAGKVGAQRRAAVAVA